MVQSVVKVDTTEGLKTIEHSCLLGEADRPSPTGLARVKTNQLRGPRLIRSTQSSVQGFALDTNNKQ